MGEMPRYKCHKEVWAHKILGIEHNNAHVPNSETDGSAILSVAEEGYNMVHVDHEYMRKHKPEVGGYYVVYKGGYKSFSPADVFEDGYTLIENDPV